MKIAFTLFFLSLATLLTCSGQTVNQKVQVSPETRFSDPDRLAPPPVNSPGFPSRATDLDVLPGFQNPPAGYGEVPFWWWSGDPLDKNRLLWQIDELHRKGISGMQVNYIHKDTPGWPTYPAEPEIFTDEWWKMWKYVAGECNQRGMGIGISGYTLDWTNGGDNLFNRIIYNIPEIQGREIKVDTIIKIAAGKTLHLDIINDAIGTWAYPVNEPLQPGKGKNLESFIKDKKLVWTPQQVDWEVWVFRAPLKPGTLNAVHPRSGKTVIEKFFQPFEDNAPGKSAEGLNYFFQDELQFGTGDYVWTDDFNSEFLKIKGYDVFDALPALITEKGDFTPKARLDFLDVKVQLSEERYFKPIFDWHWSRGKIYGCDPEGRGKVPGNYGDNFRAIRWYTAPGHDTPGGNADLIKGKVSSSIANLYKRPRVWIEGYHSLGWGATPQRLMFATCENYLYGCNLLNLHGLYYTTHGSYWEWAPPCYHFRMPYWEHMDTFLKYFERLSYLLSQGVLQAKVAVLYPVSPAQAKMNGKTSAETAFSCGTELFNNGHDFIFIDDQSMARAEIKNRKLVVSDMSFQVLVLPAMSAIRWETLMQAVRFLKSGGIVIATGSLPEASDHYGSNDPDLDSAVKELFGLTAAEQKSGKKPVNQSIMMGGKGIFTENTSQLINIIDQVLPKDVKSAQPVRAMHRKAGSRDIYMVMGAAKNSYCTFSSKGTAEIWDPWTGKNKPLLEVADIQGGTKVKMPLNSDEAQIIVFTPGKRKAEIVTTNLEDISRLDFQNGKPFLYGSSPVPGLKTALIKSGENYYRLSGKAPVTPAPLLLDDKWEFELKPTMDNQWGDFRLPITEKMIGAEARTFRYTEENSGPERWESPLLDDSKWTKVTYGFGQKFWKLGPLYVASDSLDRLLSSMKTIDQATPVIIQGKAYIWQPYRFSWRMGLEGDPGHQGWHGLKEEVTDEFICLGKPTKGFNETVYTMEEGGAVYYLWTSAFSPNPASAVIEKGGNEPAAVFLNGQRIKDQKKPLELKDGENPLLLRYDRPGRGHFLLIDNKSPSINRGTPLSMKWWDMPGRIVLNARTGVEKNAGWYRFTAPPGLRSMTIRTSGKAKVWINGKPQKAIPDENGKYETSKIILDKPVTEAASIAIRIDPAPGDYEGSAFPEPVLLECGKGLIQTGDWSLGSALECYSGGAWYRKEVNFTEMQASSGIILDLGEVVATAGVYVNGKSAGTLVSPPWKLDISEYVKTGKNKIEILVFNSLANHYSTIPTHYRGESLKSGLIGPVRVEFTGKTVLQ